MFTEARDQGRGIRPHERTVAEALRDHGYRTAIVGKWHLGHGKKEFFPTRHGFEQFYGFTSGAIDYFTLKYGDLADWYRQEGLLAETGFATELLTEGAVKFLKEQKGDRPFFLYLAYGAPHVGKGWDAVRGKATNVLQPRPQELARVQGIAEVRRREYAAMVLALDDGVGRVLAALDEAGLAKSTLVMFMTDNGATSTFSAGSNGPLRGQKGTLFEGGIRVPFLVRWPGRVRPDTRTDAVVTALDITPTLLRLAGAHTVPPGLDGDDVTPIFQGATPTADRELFWEFGTALALRVGNWKYLQVTGQDEMLFAIDRDRAEATNLAGKEPELLSRMRTRTEMLAAQMRGTNPAP